MSLASIARTALCETRLGDALRLIGAERLYRAYALRRRNPGSLQAGVFASLAAAKAAIPAGRLEGWDHEETSEYWLERDLPDQSAGYPIYFWLREVLRPGDAVVDWGGSIGITYWNYKRRTPLPDGLSWTVVEVPAIAAQGVRYAGAKGWRDLHFVSELEPITRADVFITAGAIQYMDSSIPGLFDRLKVRPKHILINKLPLTTRPDYWTLQNLGLAVMPYRVFNDRAFIAYFESNGYRLRERWTITDIPCRIPFYSRYFVPVKAGLYFERTD